MRWYHYLASAGLLVALGGCLELVDFHAAQCLADAECGNYKSCVHGQCQTKVCSSSSDCRGFDVCTNGTCQPKPCTTVADCTASYGVGRCVAEADAGGSFCHSSDYCTSNSMCTAPLVCVNSSCRGAPCSANDECFPYSCDSGSCTTTCQIDSNCHPEGMCIKSQCVNPVCTAGTESKCLGFACDVANSKCHNTCWITTALVGTDFVSTLHGCATGYVCNEGCELPCTTSQDPICGGHLCDTTTSKCDHFCSSTTECASGYFCRDSGACERGTCASDATCGGYLCANGQCSTLCATTADCASGHQCVGSACL